MSGIEELFPPAQYGWGWLVLAFGIILLGIGVGWIILALTRPRSTIDIADAPPVPLPTNEVLDRLRKEYLAAIDHIEHSYQSRNMSAREANLALSALVRTYVNEYSGLEAPVLALDDLERLGVNPMLVDAVGRHYYPGIFRRDRTVDPHAGADAARRVVTVWH